MSKTMPTIDLEAVLGDVKKLYAKDKKSQDMIIAGISDQVYTADDGIPLPEGHIMRELVGIPCLPYGKIVQFAGNPDTGKSTCAASTMAAAQAAGFQVILWETEGKFDATRLRHFGGDPSKIAFVKTNEILQGAEKVRKIITALKARYPDLKILLVWDSIGGSQSRSHADRELDNEKSGQPGQDAKENASVMKMIAALFNKYPDSICVYAANQVYAKIGMFQFGDAQSGGKKVEFYSSLIVVLKRKKTLTKLVKGIKMKTGIITQATVQKNHLGQSELSVHQMDFEITASGVKPTHASEDGDDDDEA